MPPYLHHLITVQPPRSTRLSSLVTLTFVHLHHLIYELLMLFSICFTMSLEPASFFTDEPHSTSDSSLSLFTSVVSTACVPSPLSSSITPLFHSRFKTYFFPNNSHHILFSLSLGLTPWLPVCFRYFWDFSFLSFLSLFFSYGTVR